jgi:UDP:flavonoid glycosyltransferase YjiC (YdhE family)
MIVLLPNCGFLSETSRMLAIFRALTLRGVPAVIASQGGPYEDLLDEAGVSWTRLAPGMDHGKCNAFLDGVLSLGRKNKALYPDGFIREAVRAEAEFFRSVGARMAVIGFNLTSYLSSRLANIPLASSHGGAFLPPALERNLCPEPVNPPSRQLALLPRFVQRWFANHAPWWFQGPARELSRVASELGLPPVPSFMALMCADLTLVTEVPEVMGIPRVELEAWRPRRRSLWPATRMRYTGPLFAKLDRAVPERVERFLSADEPVVYVSPTSVRKAGFLRALVHAVRRADARVLVSATVHDVKDLDGDRVLVEDVLPNHLVMPQVAGAVIMGGQGSVQTAMASGVPFVGMPLHGEQELNVALAERFGAAIRLSPAAAGTDAMTRAVRQLMNEPALRRNAMRARELYAGIDGADGCALAIVEFLDGRDASNASISR